MTIGCDLIYSDIASSIVDLDAPDIVFKELISLFRKQFLHHPDMCLSQQGRTLFFHMTKSPSLRQAASQCCISALLPHLHDCNLLQKLTSHVSSFWIREKEIWYHLKQIREWVRAISNTLFRLAKTQKSFPLPLQISSNLSIFLPFSTRIT